jgi:F-type H+-transporting ATPase subunit b
LEGLGINLGYFLVQVFSFLIVFVLLRALAYRPILEMLERRRKSVAQGLEDARVAAEARANAEKDAQSLMVKTQHENEHLRGRRAAANGARSRPRREGGRRHSKRGPAEPIRLLNALQSPRSGGGLALAAAEKIIRESLMI